MQFILPVAKLALLLFWFSLLMVAQAPLPKPFGMLLGGVALLLVLMHGALLLFYTSRLRASRHVWLDRLQLMLFGAFHLYGLAHAPADAQCLSVTASEGRPGGCQTD